MPLKSIRLFGSFYQMVIGLILVSICLPACKKPDNGPKAWEQFYGLGVDRARDIALDEVGNLVITGSTQSYGSGGTDMLLLKADKECKPIWLNAFGSTGNDNGRSVLPLSDGSILIAGEVENSGQTDIYLVKADSEGNLLWSKTMGDPFVSEYSQKVIKHPSGGFLILARKSMVTDDMPVMVIKTNEEGVLDNISYLGFDSGDLPGGISVLADGNYFISFETETTDGDRKIATVIMDSGSMISFNFIENPGSLRIAGMVQIPDGFLIGGTHLGDGTSDPSFYLAKVDFTGFSQWTTELEIGPGFFCHGINPSASGGAILSGEIQEDPLGTNLLLLEVDANGYPLWRMTYGGISEEIGKSAVTNADGNVFAAGHSNASGFEQIWVTGFKK